MANFDTGENPQTPRSYKALANTDITLILDKTQEHLILQLDALRQNKRFAHIGLPSLFTLIAVFFLLLFSAISYLHNNISHAQVLLGFSIIVISGYVILRITNNIRYLPSIINFLFGLLCIYLFLSGGVDGTGAMWFFIFPLTAIFVQRLWKGLLSSVALLITVVFIYSLDVPAIDTYIYPDAFIERFIAVYFTIIFMSFFYVFSRTTSELTMVSISKNFKEMANTDELTKLANRRHMTSVLSQEISRANRTNRKFSIIIFDLDHFKRINDDYGHDAGDEILVSIPRVLEKILRGQDLCARWGGEEFLILLPDTDVLGARHVAERLRRAFADNSVKHKSEELTVTISAGVGEYGMEETIETFLKRTDENLYKAKENGRNCIVS